MMIWIFLGIAAALLILQLGLMSALWPGKKAAKASQIPISVIVAAHNEEENLPYLLANLAMQNYEGEHEFLIVLDRCTDGSAALVKDACQGNTLFRYLEIHECPAGWSPKKFALTEGIRAARFAHLAFTDADCMPMESWLASMAASFEDGKQLVLGLGPYVAHLGLLNALIQFETLMTAAHYVGLAKLGFPYMAVGRNLGYTKAFFEAAGGFGPHVGRLSGDDDLLVNRAAVASSTAFMTSEASMVYSSPERTWKDWIRQKLRHGSAGTAYSKRSLAILSGIHLLHILFYVSLIGVLCMQQNHFWALGAYALRNVAMMGMIASLPWRNKIFVILFFPLLDILYLLYLGLLMPAAAFIQPQWKVRNGGSV
jgi:cellulose synthase/poly-beta-1,6-N-acetylglucosamine synthase-like glycosyltransferase